MLGKPTNSKQSTNTGYKLTYSSHLSTFYSRSLERKKLQAFCLLQIFFSGTRISEKTIEPLLNNLDFKLFHYKARVQPVSKINTIATLLLFEGIPRALKGKKTSSQKSTVIALDF
jgi:inorganic pyrophosphatase/exopolyphosphatase